MKPSTIAKSIAATAGAFAVAGASQVSADTINIKSGDTLYSLASRYNTTVDALAKANNISNVNLIIAGQKLETSTTKAATAKAVQPQTAKVSGTYTVVAGDTLRAIAAAHNVSVETLAAANNISNVDLILVGQSLKLSGNAATTKVAPTTQAPAASSQSSSSSQSSAVSSTQAPASSVAAPAQSSVAQSSATSTQNTATAPSASTQAPVSSVATSEQSSQSSVTPAKTTVASQAAPASSAESSSQSSAESSTQAPASSTESATQNNAVSSTQASTSSVTAPVASSQASSAASSQTPAAPKAAEPKATAPVQKQEQALSYIADADANGDNYMTQAEYDAYKANGSVSTSKKTTTQATQNTAQASTTTSTQTQAATVEKTSTSSATSTSTVSSTSADATINAWNAKRAQLGLKPVSLNASLSAKAQARAQQMASNSNWFSLHEGSNTPEVVANGFGAGSAVIDAWYNETGMVNGGHTEFIINPNLSSAGVGYYNGWIVVDAQ